MVKMLVSKKRSPPTTSVILGPLMPKTWGFPTEIISEGAWTSIR